jgi:hypothetical protein
VQNPANLYYALLTERHSGCWDYAFNVEGIRRWVRRPGALPLPLGNAPGLAAVPKSIQATASVIMQRVSWRPPAPSELSSCLHGCQFRSSGCPPEAQQHVLSWECVA